MTPNSGSSYDYKKYAMLFVDDEEKARKYFKRLFGGTFRILEASDGVEAYKVFMEHADEIGVVVTDQRMPNETGVGFMSKISHDYPDVIRILSTAYSDLDAAVASVNRGGIFRYITKPWDIPELEMTLRHAMEFFMLKRDRDSLMSLKVHALSNVLFASRLMGYALLPHLEGLNCRRVGEGLSSFVRAGAQVLALQPEAERLDVSQPRFWEKMHAAQVKRWDGFLDAIRQAGLGSAHGDSRTVSGSDLLQTISTRVPGIQARGSGGTWPALLAEERILKLLEALGGAGEVELSEETLKVSLTNDPLVDLVGRLLAIRDSAEDNSDIHRVMAAYLGVYDAGGRIQRQRLDSADGPSSRLRLEISLAPQKVAAAPGAEAARHLLDDELLISSTLGVI